MNTRIILCASGSLLMLALPEAIAGSRSGGTGSNAVNIPADTLSSGGGTSAVGTGANAVSVIATIGVIGGTVAIQGGSPVNNRQGFIPQITGLTGFDLWASTNIPPGRDASFTGDWNGDGVPNGTAYVLGDAGIRTTGKGRIPVPPSIPPDVNVYLDRSLTLDTWVLNGVSWVNGAAPTFANANYSIVGGEVVDTFITPDGRVYYRYRVEKR